MAGNGPPRWRLAVCASVLVFASPAAPALGAPAELPGSGTTNPIVAENALPGSPGWGYGAQATTLVLDGYTSQNSAPPGGQIQLHVTGNSANRYRIEVYRLGYYGGVGARLLTCLPSCTTDEPLTPQPPVPAPDPLTGYLDAGWPVTDTIDVGANWVSGEYLARLQITAGPDLAQMRMVPFVVYERTPQSPILVQVGTNTWEAYNAWGGVDLYNGGVNVSFNRPFGQPPSNWELWWDYPLIRFLESQGYWVSYATDQETDEGIDALSARRLVIVGGHDEYWTKAIRDSFENAQAAGTNMAFLGADTGQWQMRYGTGDRSIFEYRSWSADPSPNPLTKTVMFRQLVPPRPECWLEGVQFIGGSSVGTRSYTVVPGALVNPWFTRTGFTSSTVLTGLVGYEWDSYGQPNCTLPVERLFTWRGTDGLGVVTTADAVTFMASSGARVFSGGTLQYPWGLDSATHPQYYNAALRAFTINVINDLSAPASAPVATANPVITGTPAVGQPLKAGAGRWSGHPQPSVSFQWEDCDTAGASCTPISGATGSTYTPTSSDVGQTLRVTATAFNFGGTGSASSAPTPVVA